jgi:hypothetical protein
MTERRALEESVEPERAAVKEQLGRLELGWDGRVSHS